MGVLMNSGEYLAIVEQVKREIKTAQYQASVHVNTELIRAPLDKVGLLTKS